MRMSLRQRVKAATCCQEPDQVPVGVGVAATALQRFAGLSAEQYYFQPDRALAATEAFQRRFPEVFLKGGFRISYLNEPLLSSLGYKTLWTSAGPKIEVQSHRVQEIRLPDPARDGIMPKVLEDLSYFASRTHPEIKERYGNLLWVVSAGGPLGGIGELATYQRLFELMYEEPKLLHELLERYTQAALIWIQAQQQALKSAGAVPGVFIMVDEAVPLVSPKFLNEFFLPYAKRMFAATSAEMKVFHCDNDVTHLPQMISATGANVYDFNYSPLSLLKRQLAGKVCLMGNVPSLELLEEGTPEQVQEACREIIRRGAPGGGFILASAGSLTLNTKWENLDAMVEASRKYGRYPLSLGPAPEESGELEKSMRTVLTKEKVLDPEHLLDRLSLLVISGEVSQVVSQVETCLSQGLSPQVILKGGIGRGLALAIDRYYHKLAFLPEVMMANKAMETAMNALEPHIQKKDIKGRVVIGTAQGNIMEGGINLVAALLRSAGFMVRNLGVDVPVEKFVEATVSWPADILAVGVYTRTACQAIRGIATLLKAKNFKVDILVGGKGINEKKALELGAQAFANDAQQALEKALEITGKNKTPSAG